MGEFRYVGTSFLAERAQAALRIAVMAAARELAEKAKADAPEESGDLAASTRVAGPLGRGAIVRARVEMGGRASGAWYAAMVHEGTMPHTIRHNAHQALQFGGGKFAATVAHPGAPADKFLERPLIALRPHYRAHIAAAATRVF